MYKYNIITIDKNQQLLMIIVEVKRTTKEILLNMMALAAGAYSIMMLDIMSAISADVKCWPQGLSLNPSTAIVLSIMPSSLVIN